MAATTVRRAVLGALVLLAAATFLWWRRGGPAAGSPRGVLLVTLDTLRADYLGCYGSKRASTPTLDALAATGLRFADCGSASPLTLPSHATIFTGLLPEAHGLRANSYYRYDAPYPTLAERLRQAGYRTGAVLGSAVLDRQVGLDRGFDGYDDLQEQAGKVALPFGGELVRRAGEVTDRAIRWLEGLERGQRFFLWVHYFDPHWPYDPPEAWAGRHPQDPYAGEVEYTDAELGRLLAALDGLGLGGRTLIVAVADHGEGLGDHGEDRHGHFLYQATLHVPLLVALPGRLPAGQVVGRPVSTADIAPTVLDLLGLPPLDPCQGRSLAAAAGDGGRDDGQDSDGQDSDGGDEPVYAETLHPRLVMRSSRLKSVRQGRFKLILGSRPELYDLAEDPGETHDLIDRDRDTAARLDGSLRQLVRGSLALARPAPAAIDVSPERMAQLQALGYAGGGIGQVGLEDELDFTGPSPMDRTATIHALEGAMVALHEGRVGEAVAQLERLAAAEPDNFGVHMQLAQALVQSGRGAEAEPHLDRVLAEDPDFPPALEVLGDLRLFAGRLDESVEMSDRLLRHHPGDPRTWRRKGVALLRLGRPGEAARALERSLELDPFSAEGVVLLTQAELGGQDVRAALAAAQRGVTLKPDEPITHALLAEALHRSGDTPSAIREAERALALDRTGRYRQSVGEQLARYRAAGR